MTKLELGKVEWLLQIVTGSKWLRQDANLPFPIPCPSGNINLTLSGNDLEQWAFKRLIR